MKLVLKTNILQFTHCPPFIFNFNNRNIYKMFSKLEVAMIDNG